MEEELGEAIQQNLDLSPIEDLQQDLLDYVQTALEIVDIVDKVINALLIELVA